MENECCCCDLALVVSVRLCMSLLDTLAAVLEKQALECCQSQGNGYHLSFSLDFGFCFVLFLAQALVLCCFIVNMLCGFEVFGLRG